MKRLIACLLVFVLGFPLSLWSQSQVAGPSEVQKLLEDQQSAKAKDEVQRRGAGERSRVKVTLRNTTEVKGYISRIDADSFQVTDRKSGHVTTVAYQNVTGVHGGGGMSSGAKIALATGIGAAVIVVFVVLGRTLNHS
jgi:Flp pilus assembly protein TadB